MVNAPAQHDTLNHVQCCYPHYAGPVATSLFDLHLDGAAQELLFVGGATALATQVSRLVDQQHVATDVTLKRFF